MIVIGKLLKKKIIGKYKKGMFKIDVQTFLSTTLSILYLTLSRIFRTLLDNFSMTKLTIRKAKDYYVINGHYDFLVLIIKMQCFLKGIQKMILESLKSIRQF